MSKFDKAFDTLDAEGVSLVQDQPFTDVVQSPSFEPRKSPFDSLFENKEFTETLTVDQNTPLRGAMIDATKQNPDEWAEADKLSSQTGIPTDVVQRNMSDIKAQQKFDQIDYSKIGKESPKTSAFLSDPVNASQAYDDVDALTGIERNVAGNEWWEQLEDQYIQESLDGDKSSFVQFMGNDIPNIVKSFGARALAGGEKSLAGVISAFQETATQHIPTGREEEYAAYSLVDPRTVNNMPKELYNEAMMVLEQIDKENPTVTKGGEVFTGAIDSLTQQTPGLLLGVLARNPSLALTLMGTNTFGQTYADSRAAGMEREDAFQNALFQGTVEAGTELLPFIRFAGMIDPGKKFSKKAISFMMAEFPGEAIATALQRSSDVYFDEADPDKRMNQVKEYLTSKEHWTQDQLDTFLQTAVQTTLMAGGAKTVQYGLQKWTEPGQVASQKLAEEARNTVAKTRVEQEKIDDLAEQAVTSKLQTRNPEAVKKFVEQAATEDDNIYIPGKELNQYLQENNIDPTQDPAFRESADQIAEAVALDGDVLIPTADFVAYIADSDHYEPLRQHMRLSSDTMTPVEQTTMQEEQQQFIAETMQKAEENAEVLVESQAVYEDVKEQLIDTGRVTEQVASISAQIIPAWVTVKAQETGKSVQEIYEAAGFRVEGPFKEKQAELEARAAALEQGQLEVTKIKEGDVGLVETGKPVSFNFVHNTESATGVFGIPEEGDQFGRDFEPAGRFVSVTGDNFKPMSDQMVTGEMTLVNPLVVDNDGTKWKETLSNQYNGKTGKELSKALIEDGYDGVITLEGDKYISEVVEFTTFDEKKALYQSELPQDMYVAHNLSADNLIFADKVGGLAVPSVAVARTSTGGFDNFGEISLLANPSLIDPKGGGKSRVFNADVYSPRYPKVLHKIDNKVLSKLVDELSDSVDALGGSVNHMQELEDRGMQNVIDSPVVQYEYLKSIGKEPRVKKKAKVTVPAYLKKYAKMNQYSMSENADFKNDAKRYWNDRAEAYANKVEDKPELRDEVLKGMLGNYFNEEGDVRRRYLEELADKVSKSGKPAQVDFYATRDAIAKKLKPKKTTEGFEEWVYKKFGDVFIGERIFNGFTYSGNRKYLNHDLDTVVKILKKELRDGEGFNYGVGSIRSTIAKEFKSIKSIQADREQIVDSEEMKRVKDEIDKEFNELVEELSPYYKYDASGFGYLDDASNALKEFSTRGLRGFSEYYEGVPEELLQDVGEFMQKLRNMPTEYFEAKIGRAVDFNEFQVALVPSDTKKQALDILKREGIKVKKYDKRVGKNEAFAKLEKSNPELFFQEDPTAPTARGFFDPENNLIRLTEASDLSTFLHESAHFFLEMEKKLNPEGVEAINDWFKRNAGEVAAEANRYLGESGQLEQGQVVTSTPEFKNWFGESKVVDEAGDPLIVYHGSDSDFDTFDMNRNAKRYTTFTESEVESQGAFFSPSETDSETYGDNVRAFYLSVKNPLIDPRSIEISSKATDDQKQKVADAWDDFEYIFDAVIEDGYIDIAGGMSRVEVTDDLVWMDSVIGDDITDWNYLDNPEFVSRMKERGYDGVRVEETEDESGMSWFVTGPNQIKSVDNRGTFDPTDTNVFNQEQETPTGIEGTITPEHVTQYLDEGGTGNAALDDAIRRATHEQFARGFETYLMEGKAPSIELRDAFRAFARWLTDLYRKVRGQLNVKLDDQMRKVFDRMIATEEQIAATEAADRYQPLFTDAAMAGMTEKEFEAYKKKTQGATDKANETLREKILGELKRQTESWWKEDKRDRTATIIEQLRTQPVYSAIDKLKTKDGELKMDRAMVKSLLDIKAIPPALRNMTVTGGTGVTPDDAAAFLGFRSGDEMINEILNAPKIQELADSQAEAEMKVEHGDILNDGTLEQQAQDAAHNEERGRAILTELKQLSKGRRVPTIDRATIKQLAKENIGRLPLNKIRPAKYRRAEIKAAVASQKALNKGDSVAALQHKTQQAMNFYLWRAAVDAQTRGALIERYTRRFNKKTTRTELLKAGNGYMEQIDGILNRFQFRGSVKQAEIDRQNIEAWAVQRTEDGDNLQLTKEVLAENFRMHYKEVPFEALEGVYDSLRNLNHVARFANKIKKNEELIEFQEVKKEWIEHLEDLPDKFNASRTDVVTGGATKKFNWAISQMTKIPMLASWLDGGKRVGLSHDLMIQPITDAVHDEQQLWDEVGSVVLDAIKNRTKEDTARHNRKIWIPEIEDHLLGHQVLSVALNAGNRSNLEKMLKGEGWVPADAAEEEITIDNPQLQAVLTHMNQNDWQLVELIWKQIDLLFPKMAEVHKATSGLTLPKVEAEKFETPYGEVTGGYYPIKYDPMRSKRASDTQDKIDEQTRSMFAEGGFLKPNADTGAKIERTQYFAPIRLSLDVVPNHMQEVIHYITHFGPVRQIHKLTNDPDISEAMIRKIGRDEYRQIKPWLNDIAKDGKEAPSKTFFEEALAKLRFGTTLGMMGFKASTGIIQISGLSNTYAEVGAGYANRGLRHVVGSPQSMKDAWKFASENSKIMSDRVNTMDREVRNAMKKLEGKRGLLAATQEASMKHIALIQTYMVDLPTWFAAYYKEIDVAKAEIDAENFDSMDDYNKAVDKRAFRRADWTVENVQGSGLTKDLPSIMRNQGEATRMFTMFFTFFSSLWNMERDLVRGAKSGQYSPTTIAAKAMFLFAVPVAFEMVMRGQLTDSGDDDEEAWERYLTGLALYPIQSVPFVRDVVNGVSGEYKYQLTPLAGIIESGLRGAPGVADSLVTDEELTKSQAKGTSKLIGAWVGVPGVSQAWNSGEHLYEVVSEGEQLTIQELLFGPQREK